MNNDWVQGGCCCEVKGIANENENENGREVR